MRHTLEEHKIFPIVAWCVVLLGCFFVYKLTMNVSKEIEQLGSSRDNVVNAVHRDLRSGHVEY